MKSDLRQGEEWGRFLASQGWEVDEVKWNARKASVNGRRPFQKAKVKVYIRKIPLIGSVVKIQRPPAMPPVETLDGIAKKHHALFVKLEPPLTADSEPLINCGFAPDPAPCLPTKTVIIDLVKPEKELWQNLSQDARQSIRKAESNQLSVISYRKGNKDLEGGLTEFHQLLKSTGQRVRSWSPNFKTLRAKAEAFGKNATLLLAYPPTHKASEGRVPLAGALILIHDRTAYYHHAASTREGQKLHAPYLLMWKIIKFLKSPKPYPLNPSRYLDLEGIYDPRYHRATKWWRGFSVFKKKFGGTEIDYPSPLIRYYNPIVKLLSKSKRP